MIEIKTEKIEIKNTVEQINTEIPDNRIDTHRIYGAPQPPLTDADATAFVSNASGSVADSGIVTLDNMRTRIGEIESRLKALGLLLP